MRDRPVLGIIITDLTYMQYMLAYLRQSEFPGVFRIQAFTRMPEQHVVEALDVILTTAEMQLGHVVTSASKPIFRLHSQIIDLSEEHLLQQYQPFDQMFAKLNQFLTDRGLLQTKTAERKQTQNIFFCSLSGGTGKTTLAISLAAHLAEKGKKVFYFNGEDISCVSIPHSTASLPDLSKYLFDLQQGKVDSQYWVGQVHPVLGFYYFRPSVQFRELDHLNAAEISTFCRSFAEHSEFDTVIMDISAGLSGKTIDWLNQANHICWVLTDNRSQFRKMQSLRSFYAHQLEPGHWLNRSMTILNQCTGRPVVSDKFPDVPVDCIVPYVHEWNPNVHFSFEDIHPSFHESAAKIYAKIAPSP